MNANTDAEGNSLVECGPGSECTFKNGTINMFAAMKCGDCHGDWFEWDEHQYSILTSVSVPSCRWLPTSDWVEAPYLYYQASTVHRSSQKKH